MWISANGRTKIVRCGNQYEILILADRAYETVWRHFRYVATQNILVAQSKMPSTTWTKI